MYDIEELKQGVDVRELVASDLGEPERKSGEIWYWLCPFHGERHASFAVRNDHYFCHGACGSGGDAIDYVMRRQGLDFLHACAWLEQYAQAGHAHAALQPQRCIPTFRALKCAPTQAWQSQIGGFVAKSQARLFAPGGSYALNWLRGRGLFDETLRTWQIGWNPCRREVGGVECGLEGQRLWLPVGIVIPGFVEGKLWYCKIRQLHGDPKYLHVRGGVPALFGTQEFCPGHSLILCEGEFDAMLLHQEAGDLVNVATFGSASPGDITQFSLYLMGAPKIWIVMDNDAAGRKASAKWQKILARARVVSPPESVGKDITDAWKDGGNLRQWVSDLLNERLALDFYGSDTQARRMKDAVA